MFSTSSGCDNKLYNILGVSKTAGENEIKKAYRKKAMKYHPDKSQGENKKENEDKFKAISSAYEVLKDPEKRSTYDRFGEEGLQGMGGFEGGNPFDIFSNIFGGGMGGHSRRRRPTRAKDRVEEINIDLEDIYNEVTKKLDIKQKVRCLSCFGSGAASEKDIKVCSQCDGTGRMMKIMNIGPGMIQQAMMTCDKCGGVGKIILKRCPTCDGKKYEIKKKIINLPIESNFRSGKKVVIPGLAHYDPDCEEQGDLVLVIQLIEHEVFKIKNTYDLEIEKSILLSDALCGVSFNITHLDGKTFMVKFSDIVKPGKEYVIKNEGLSNENGYDGDLYLNFKIIFPDNLDEQRKKYLQKLLPVQSPEAISRAMKSCQEIKFMECQGDKIEMEEINLGNHQESHDRPRESNSGTEGVECVQQ